MSRALETLLWPFRTGALPTPEGEVLFLRARTGDALAAFLREHPEVPVLGEQSFRPYADELERAGLLALADSVGAWAQVWVLPPRQRVEARATLAEAVRRCRDGGLVIASVANNEGARSIAADFESLVGSVAVESKNKCRVFWSTVERARVDTALVAAWREAAAPRRIEPEGFWSRPGLFAWDRVDAASALLATHLPDDLAGRCADLGAGWGYLTQAVLERCPRVTHMDLYEAESRALDLARENCVGRADVNVRYFWHDVTRGLLGRYDVIVSNPPFHTDHADQPELGQAFIASAARALEDGGRLFLVANRHLPYEATLAAHFRTVRILACAEGFKVFEGAR